MKSKPTLRDAFNSQRVESPHPPLLSDDDILQVIRTSSLEAPAAKQPVSRTAVRWIGAVAAVASVAICVALLLPSRSNVSNHNFDINDTQHTNERVMADLPDDPTPPALTNVPSQAITAAQPDTSSLRTLDLPTTSLDKLGIRQHRGAIIYQEDDCRITIKTNGISATEFAESSVQHTPRHVTLYRNGKPFASWFDSSATSVNNLVPVKLRVEDPGNAMFPAADVILWYIPTEAFLQAIPDVYRLALGKELKGAQVSQGFLERRTSASSITSSRVFPNPVHGTSASLELLLSKQCRTSARLVDLQGSTLRTLWTSHPMPSGATTMPISHLDALPNGMYLVVVSIDGTLDHIIQRILIER